MFASLDDAEIYIGEVGIFAHWSNGYQEMIHLQINEEGSHTVVTKYPGEQVQVSKCLKIGA